MPAQCALLAGHHDTPECLQRAQQARRVAPTSDAAAPTIFEEQQCTLSAVLVHLVASVAALDPVATNPANAHAAAGALLRMLRQGDVREAARAAIKAAEGDERAARSVEIGALNGMLGAAAAPGVPCHLLWT